MKEINEKKIESLQKMIVASGVIGSSAVLQQLNVPLVFDSTANSKAGIYNKHGAAIHLVKDFPGFKLEDFSSNYISSFISYLFSIGENINNACFIDEEIHAISLANKKLSNVTFDNCLLEEIDFTCASFIDCKIINTDISKCDFSSSEIIKTKTEKTSFKDSIFNNTTLYKSGWSKTKLNNCVLKYAIFIHSPLINVDFSNSIIFKMRLSNGNMTGVLFYSCEISNCIWENSNAENVLFKNSNLINNIINRNKYFKNFSYEKCNQLNYEYSGGEVAYNRIDMLAKIKKELEG